ncbi:MAG TPA: LytTR family DNA-binding domain-containing protein [Puia sp.]|jgi:DNA-binding LytR/AlgR family response regulator|nr:LytTR family DNA-binding domain-containing protein [Puia sp.]
MLNCVIVDDEPLAREGLADYVKEIDFLQLAGVCINPVELGKLLGSQKIDLMFLDIQMPKMNGIDFLRILPNPPMVIITTAFSEYALDGFQLNVLDYLLKPITFDRFFKAVVRARDYHLLTSKTPSADPTSLQRGEDFVFIKCSNKFEKIHFADILYIEALQNYVAIYTTRGKFLTLLYLKNIEQNLDNKAFIRVHKSYIVPIARIDSIDGNEIRIAEHRVPVSRNYRELVIRQVVNNNLWSK